MKTLQQSAQKGKTQDAHGERIGKVSFRVPLETRRQLRRLSFDLDVPMQDLGTRAITEFVERNRKG